MRYYIRQHETGDIEGPFAVVELAAGVSSGYISPDSIVSSDIGNSVKDLHRGSRCDWISLSDLSEFKQLPASTQLVSLRIFAWDRSTLYFILAFVATLTWTLFWGITGLVAGAETVHSPGYPAINKALLIHYPAIFVLAAVLAGPPVWTGDEADSELMLLVLITLPSCIGYGLIARLVGKYR